MLSDQMRQEKYILKQSQQAIMINKGKVILGLAGNPNVGKSTIFNTLTGLKQHTGNWAGKTVSNAVGEYRYKNREYKIYDLPGTYSLNAQSKEEECASEFICFEKYDVIIVVCDAVCLERNLNLVLQILEVTNRVIVVVNLIDEARKKQIDINTEKLSELLNVSVVSTSARNNIGINELMEAITLTDYNPQNSKSKLFQYSSHIEYHLEGIESILSKYNLLGLSKRTIAVNLLINNIKYKEELEKYFKKDISETDEMKSYLEETRCSLLKNDIVITELQDEMAITVIHQAEAIARKVVKFNNQHYYAKDRKLDKILTNRWMGIPIMLMLLMLVFWITMVGANYPSELLFNLFENIGNYITILLNNISLPIWLIQILMEGIYRVLTWVIAVMLPPMAIFFPLFTLLEDLGYLPRVAFNMDRCFQKCSACGKQALTMCMGFGCNAVGVVGSRIIDSPRERLIAIITNSFVPCNGRFPTIIAIITMFFTGFENNLISTIKNVGVLVFFIIIGIGVTFLVSKVLSKTLLKGMPSFFTLELPPYRKPQIGKVISRSILDRTVHILGRAILVAAPAGMIIWLLANIKMGNFTILIHLTNFFDPFARIIGLDGAIFLGFVLGFPANEIVLPIIMMIYLSNGSLTEFDSLLTLRELLVSNGWTSLTAICVILFSLMHWPCSTTCLTIKKETGSWKWTIISIIIPTLIGIIICFLLTTIVRLLF